MSWEHFRIFHLIGKCDISGLKGGHCVGYRSAKNRDFETLYHRIDTTRLSHYWDDWLRGSIVEGGPALTMGSLYSVFCNREAPIVSTIKQWSDRIVKCVTRRRTRPIQVPIPIIITPIIPINAGLSSIYWRYQYTYTYVYVCTSKPFTLNLGRYF